MAAEEALAINLLLDRDAKLRNDQLAKLKTELGLCAALESLTAATATRGEAVWRCERGRLRARVLLAPTTKPSLQTLEFDNLK